MRKLVYFFIVLFISFEFLLLLVGLVIYFYLENLIGNFALPFRLNSEFVNWLMLVPSSLFVWIFLEVRSLLIGDKESIRVLLDWDDYWMLKTHTLINLIYSSIFLLFSMIPVLVEGWIKDGRFLLIFSIGFLGLLISARDIFFASIKLKELVGRLKSP